MHHLALDDHRQCDLLEGVWGNKAAEAQHAVAQRCMNAAQQSALSRLLDAARARSGAIAIQIGARSYGPAADSVETGRGKARTLALDAAAFTSGRDHRKAILSARSSGRTKKKPRPCDDSHSGATLAKNRVTHHEQNPMAGITARDRMKSRVILKQFPKGKNAAAPGLLPQTPCGLPMAQSRITSG
jgi:hypothetical protein